MTAPPSLLGRIVLRLTLTTLAAIICAYGWLWLTFQSTTGSLRDKSLIEAARTVAQAVRFRDGNSLTIDLPASLIEAYAASEGVHGFSVRDRASGAILIAGGADPGPVPMRMDETGLGTLYQYNPDGPGPAVYFGEALPFQLDGHRLVVQVVRLGSDYQVLAETLLGEFFEEGGWLTAPFLLVLLAVSILTIRGTFRPLRALSDMAEAIGPATADLRLPHDDVPREVMPLVRAVNDALDRLEAGIRQQREFIGDAAHELRTPLAVLAAHIDTLPDRKTAQGLRRDLDGMTHLVEQLLRIARAEALVVQPNEQADLGDIARDVAAYLGPVAIRSGRMLEVEAPDRPVMVHGQSDALFHALRNLVENALRHTPVDTTVLVAVGDDPPALMVRDHGPGVPTELRTAVFQRFWRSARHGTGTGLGLAIVQRTMQAHGGGVVVEDADGGGAQFRMVFPQQ
ncbi:MAG: sensor histidine kinase [Actinomycetota bacterium]